MIERDEIFKNFIITCDVCGDDEGLDEYDFFDAVNEAKSNGWKIFKEQGEWMHKCPSCAELKS